MTASLHVVASRQPGGAETFFCRLVEGLNRGAPGSATALTVAGGSVASALDPATPQHHLPMRGVWDVWSRLAIPRLARRLGVPIVQTYMGRATRLTHLGGRPVHVARIGGHYDPAQYAHADFCVAASRALADHLVRGGMDARRIEVIGNFVDPVPAVPAAELAALRRDLRLPEDVFVVAAIARLHPQKGLDTLLDAAAALSGRLPLALVIVGDGPLGATLEARADALGLAGRTRFVGWQTPTAPWYQLADLIALPSRLEGYGNIVIEAWANGRPIVATRAFGPSEMIEDGVTGRLVPIDDAPALAAAIADIAADPAGARALAEAGRAALADRFAPERIIGRYRDLYARLAGA